MLVPDIRCRKRHWQPVSEQVISKIWSLKMALKELLLICVSVYATVGDEGGALSYTESDFDDKISDLPHFIKFFAPW